MVFTDEDKAAIKFWPLNKHYGAKRLCGEFPIKNWSFIGLKLEENRRDRVYRRTTERCRSAAVGALK